MEHIREAKRRLFSWKSTHFINRRKRTFSQKYFQLLPLGTFSKEIHKFTQNKTTNESGGMLIGTILEEFGKTNIIISGFIEAKYCEATPTTLKFTHETWEYVHKEIEKKHPGKKIVGWIHTHPDFGIFLSEYDKFIHQQRIIEDLQTQIAEIQAGQTSPGDYIVYTVKTGDTLAGICKSLGIDYHANRETILSLNHIANENIIHTGQVLLFPKAAEDDLQ